MNANDFLKELGLPAGAHTPDDMKRAWKKKASEHHPDKGGDPEKFLTITHAYKMLTDPSYRHENESVRRPHKPDLHVRMQIPVTFEEAFFGRTINVNFNRLEFGEDMKPIRKDTQEILYIEIKLPSGSLDGHETHFSGYGLKRGEEVGDLKIKILPQAHTRFQHRGADILSEEQVPLEIMLKGGRVEVATMYGLRTLNIPAGTAPSSRLKIKGCGIGKLGDHVVQVDAIFPTKEELKAWKGLAVDWSIGQDEEDLSLENMFDRVRGGRILFDSDIYKAFEDMKRNKRSR